MKLIRTSLRIDENLKKTAEMLAVKHGLTLQEIFNRSLEAYLNNLSRQKAKKLVFNSYDLGTPLDNLTRSDYYPKP